MVTSVCNIGVYIDADINFRTHVVKTFRTHVVKTITVCFSALHQICPVKHNLPQHALLILVCVLISNNHSIFVIQLSATNSITATVLAWRRYFCTPAELVALCAECYHLARQLTLVVRAHNSTASAASLVMRPQRIQFWLCVLAYQRLHGTAPAYLSDI